jgi:hypothetical protein
MSLVAILQTRIYRWAETCEQSDVVCDRLGTLDNTTVCYNPETSLDACNTTTCCKPVCYCYGWST